MRTIKSKILIISIFFSLLTGCAAFNVEQKTLIDYRHSDEYIQYWVSGDKQYSQHYNEQWELLWEYKYEDGHTERHWEKCTRFEYQEAKEELGEVDP